MSTVGTTAPRSAAHERRTAGPSGPVRASLDPAFCTCGCAVATWSMPDVPHHPPDHTGRTVKRHHSGTV
ncbi:hypothetical protein ABT354_12740 [Streptomyces sp. NPDC000594]|uniref:hypothetical protein n=1 Tax=Streptomyces sp. NPDC000594 TaxID=3154261 RepID=UPI00332C8E14